MDKIEKRAIHKKKMIERRAKQNLCVSWSLRDNAACENIAKFCIYWKNTYARNGASGPAARAKARAA